MKNNRFYLLYIAFVFIGNHFSANAQSLLETLEKEYPNTPQYETATFKATRIAIGQSVENRKKGVLQLSTQNRFWNTPAPQDQTFIADKWWATIGAEYGISNNLSAGINWATWDNSFDTYFKYNLFRQQKNNKQPFSVSYFQNAALKNSDAVKNTYSSTRKRLAFTSQLLIAHKFNSEFSVQVAPTFIHRNFDISQQDPNNHFAIGFGARYKVAPHVSIVSEYYHLTNPIASKTTFNAFALGVNWDVRYLLLQFQMTNARSMVEDTFISQTPNNFNSNDGNFVFGFNAVFTFQTNKNK